jgi:hypothetical protein
VESDRGELSNAEGRRVRMGFGRDDVNGFLWRPTNECSFERPYFNMRIINTLLKSNLISISADSPPFLSLESIGL